jgi:2-methylene-furan-3-one reductase
MCGWVVLGDVSNALKAVKEGGIVLTINDRSPKPPASFYSLTANGDNLSKLVPFLENGKIKPVLDPKGHFTFSQVKEAFQYLETSRASGKVVVAPIE